MRFACNSHLAYCTNIHRGSSWAETQQTLERYTLAVRDRVSPDSEYAIGLRLSAAAAKELSDPDKLLNFQRWLKKNHCYIFTINGFPYGDFHGTQVKDQVYRPDWTTQDRLDYTNLLFDLLSKLLPPGMEGSVSTLPGSFKRFISNKTEEQVIFDNLLANAYHIESLSKSTGHDLHLGLEPEPLGYFETSEESVAFFERFLEYAPTEEDLILKHLGINYDTCHFAIEYESAAKSLQRLRDNRIRISKIHLSSALKVSDFSDSTLQELKGFCEDTYLHQVIARSEDQTLQRYEDLNEGLDARIMGNDSAKEWRIHFHIPLHTQPKAPLLSTSDHIKDTFDFLKDDPDICNHFEIETYTWEVLPEELAEMDVVEQLVKEYIWIFRELDLRGLRS